MFRLNRWLSNILVMLKLATEAAWAGKMGYCSVTQMSMVLLVVVAEKKLLDVYCSLLGFKN